jgi:rod shape-determining protein MreB
MDEAIIEYVLKEKKVLIGQRTAEAAKIKIGTLLEDADTEETEVKGVSTITDLPASVKITNREISEAIAPTAERITKAIHTLFEKTPPELTGDILENGIILTGGTALTRGIDKFISVRLGVKVRVMDDAINRVAIGTGTCFKVTDDLIDASFEEAGI